MEAPICTLRRYHILILMCMGNMLAYMTRFAVSVTLLAMENITTFEMAQIESSFFYGYCIGTAPMGFVGDKLGARLACLGARRRQGSVFRTRVSRTEVSPWCVADTGQDRGQMVYASLA